MIVNSSSSLCPQCECAPGWAGPGLTCGPDNDADGWSDTLLDCSDTSCAQARHFEHKDQREGSQLGTDKIILLSLPLQYLKLLIIMV